MKVCPNCGGKNIVPINPITGENIGFIALTILECRAETVYWFCDDCYEMWSVQMKKCVKCGKEASMEITNQYADGQRETKYYCDDDGKPVFQNLFREMYGLSKIIEE